MNINEFKKDAQQNIWTTLDPWTNLHPPLTTYAAMYYLHKYILFTTYNLSLCDNRHSQKGNGIECATLNHQ